MTVGAVDTNPSGRAMGDWRYTLRGVCCDLWRKRALKEVLMWISNVHHRGGTAMQIDLHHSHTCEKVKEGHQAVP